MAYCRKCGAELAADASFCHKCGTPVGAAGTVSPEVHQVFKIEGKPKITVRTTVGSGSVHITTGTAKEIAVDLKLKGPENLGYDITQNGRDVLVRVWPRVHPAISWFYYLGTGAPRADISITTVAESDLDIDSALSDVSISGLKGSIAAESTVTALHVTNCEGSLRARTRTGSVVIDSFKGGVTARSNVGSINFSGSLAGEGENYFRTNVGSIQLTLRGPHNLTAELLSNIGGITCTPELNESRRDYGRYQGKLGSGTGRLQVQTNTGNISLVQSA